MKSLLIHLVIAFAFTSFGQSNLDTIAIFFNFNEHEITGGPTIQLPDHAQIVKIEAHCDTIGSISYNKSLAQRRLNYVVNDLKSNFISLSSVKLIALGEPHSNLSNNYSDHDFRRVDIIFSSEETKELVNSQPIAKSDLVQNFEAFLLDTTTKTDIELSILFIPGYPILLQESYPEMQELFDFMRYNTNVHAHIHGHVCCADDYKLSLDRAYMVYSFLTKRGISPSRLKYTGHSNKQPKISPEETEADRRLNRRVSITFTKQ